MKKIHLIGILAALLLVVMPAMANSLAEYHLYAGKNIHVGDIGVYQDSGNLVVEFDMDEGWYINETHLAVKQYDSWIPQKKGNPIPGKFQYSLAYEIPESNDAYVIPMPAYSPIHIAFQADVAHAASPGVGAPAGDALFPPPSIVYDQEEGAWAAETDPGTFAFGGSNWATYFHYPRPV
jgi:hypothetical protein